jgi:hypothetical protein
VKEWGHDGNIYIGGYKDGIKTEGKEYQLQSDRTYTLFHVKRQEKKEISKGHKIE